MCIVFYHFFFLQTCYAAYCSQEVLKTDVFGIKMGEKNSRYWIVIYCKPDCPCVQKVGDLFPVPVNFPVASFGSATGFKWKCITPLCAFQASAAEKIKSSYRKTNWNIYHLVRWDYSYAQKLDAV